jgi:hypothetical protein
VSVDEAGPADVMAFARELNLTFDILHDRRGQIQQRYFTTGVPESFLIDGEGIIVRKQIGEHPWSSPANRRILEQLLGQKGTSIPVPDEAPVASEPELKPSGG